jgi:tRNA modification GTPase
MIHQEDAICALATPQGIGAIALIRVSGKSTFEILDKLFYGKKLSEVASHTIHFGTIRENQNIIDEVLISVFKTPHSYTKEDTAEISCHGSDYIIRTILRLLVQNGCKMAKAGEFTQRAFLNGQLDLVQAEAVADLIAADSASAHQIAVNQLRGGFSKKLGVLREELIHFASLIELELDFGEEDVEFANRADLRLLIDKIQTQIRPLIDSFDAGNAIKEGIPVAIIGPPNSGKSTLLNALLNEEKAIVTPIAGTTRDIIEDVLFIEGIKFRIIDTAGIRETQDLVESIGIERSKAALDKSEIVFFLFENDAQKQELESEFATIIIDKKPIWIRNKVDLASNETIFNTNEVNISAKNGTGLDTLQTALMTIAKAKNQSDTTITNMRHFEHLLKANEALDAVLFGLDAGITADFVAQDIRLSLHHLGEITGQITTDDLLANIFGKFCIGK